MFVDLLIFNFNLGFFACFVLCFLCAFLFFYKIHYFCVLFCFFVVVLCLRCFCCLHCVEWFQKDCFYQTLDSLAKMLEFLAWFRLAVSQCKDHTISDTRFRIFFRLSWLRPWSRLSIPLCTHTHFFTGNESVHVNRRYFVTTNRYRKVSVPFKILPLPSGIERCVHERPERVEKNNPNLLIRVHT